MARGIRSFDLSRLCAVIVASDPARLGHMACYGDGENSPLGAELAIRLCHRSDVAF
jgi:hypothetical protein